MADQVRFPRLLDAAWQEQRRLTPTAYSLALIKNDVSTAHLALNEEDEQLRVMDWVELYTLKGSAGIFRVSQRDTPAGGPGGYDLRHGICCLHDSVWNNRLDAQGNLLDTDFSGTVAQYMAAVLSHQRTVRWQLGACEDAGQWKKSGLNHDHLDSLLLEMAQARAGYMLAYDFSTEPWTVSLVACAGQVNAECRQSRNIMDSRHRQSQSGMVNRLYLTVVTEEKKDTAPAAWSGGADKGQPTGKVTPDEDKVTETGVTFRIYNDAASQAQYGILEGTAEIRLSDVPDPDAWAAQYFRDHAQPLSQASADAYELVKQTGECWDQYDLGKWCRIALKRDGYPAEGPIEQIQYSDLLGEPDKAKVELTRKPIKASERLSALKSAADAASRTGGGGGGGAARAKEVTHWAQVVQHILEELDGTGIRQLWESGIELDAQQGATIYSLYQGLTDHYAAIKVANNQISLVVREDQGGYIVNSASIVAAINDSGSSVILSGDKIDINANQEYRQTILKKSAVYPQFTDPAQETGAGIQDGDVWVKTNSTRTWADMGEASWVDSTEFEWQDYYGAETYIRKNGKWELIENQQQDYINGTQIRQNENEIALVAGNLEGYHAQFTVAADEIRGEVANTQGQLSVVSQKADEVSIEVANARGSEATLGARLAVTDQAITSKVSAGDIASTINQTAQSVLIQAQKIDLQGYVTASQLSAELADFETQWATSITTDWFRADLADIELLRINTALQINSQYAEWQSTTIGGVTLHYLGSAPT